MDPYIIALLLLLALLVTFFCTEHWRWHRSLRAENRFWGFFFMTFIFINLHLDGSPIRPLARMLQNAALEQATQLYNQVILVNSQIHSCDQNITSISIFASPYEDPSEDPAATAAATAAQFGICEFSPKNTIMKILHSVYHYATIGFYEFITSEWASYVLILGELALLLGFFFLSTYIHIVKYQMTKLTSFTLRQIEKADLKHKVPGAVGGASGKNEGTSNQVCSLEFLHRKLWVQHAQILTDTIAEIHYAYSTSLFPFIADVPMLTMQDQVLDIITEASANELNYLLLRVNSSRLFLALKDYWFWSKQKFRTNAMRLLFEERVHELGVLQKAALLDGLMKFSVRGHNLGSKWVASLFLSTQSKELIMLKNIIDASGEFDNDNYHTCHKLLFRDMYSKELRKKVLLHLKKNARNARQTILEDLEDTFDVTQSSSDLTADLRSIRKLTSMGALPIIKPSEGLVDKTIANLFNNDMRFIKILSDVDDTLVASGGDGIAGIDKRYPKKTLYPGVTAFYREIDLGPKDGARFDSWPEGRLGNLTFLSARPHLYKDYTERASFSMFRKLPLHTKPCLLAGDLGGVRIITGNYEPVASKKFENFMEYAQVYPESNFVWVGDNGQGDVSTAEKVLKQEPSIIRGIFINLVQPIDKTYGDYKFVRDHPYAIFFKTYIEAALGALKIGLISHAGAIRIAQEAMHELQGIEESMKKKNKINPKFQEVVDDHKKAFKDLMTCSSKGVPKIKMVQSLPY